MNTSNIKDKWPMHVFFISQGISLFGVGYTVLPIILLLFWLINIVKKTRNILVDFVVDDQIRWIVFYYVVFVFAVFMSDLIMKGSLTNLDGPLYKIAFGVFAMLGYAIAKSFDSNELQKVGYSWIVFWVFVLLIFIEFYYRGIYQYHHGIFVAPHILFSGLIMIGLINVAYLAENRYRNKLASLVSAIMLLWSLFCSYRYSVSDVLPHLYLVCILIMFVLSANRASMYVVSILFIALIIFFLLRSDILEQLIFVDLTHANWWMELLNERQYVWSAVIRMIGQYPFWGVGSGNFSTVCKNILTEMNSSSPYSTFAHAHNLLLQNFAVHGAIAGTAFIALLLSIFRLIFNTPICKQIGAFRLAMLGLWLVYVLYSAVDNAPLYEEIIPLFWGSLGLFMGMVAKERIKKDDSTSEDKRYNPCL